MEDVIGFYWKCGFRFNYRKRENNIYDSSIGYFNRKIK